MIIYLEEENKVEESILEKMQESAEYLINKEGIDEERSEVSLTIVSPEEIRELNRDYRGKDSVTDVLSFPQFEPDEEVPEDGEIMLGDVVINVDRVKTQAEEFGHSFEREFVYLFTHSILHLLGYDHEEEDEKALMRKLEEDAMEHIGLTR